MRDDIFKELVAAESFEIEIWSREFMMYAGGYAAHTTVPLLLSFAVMLMVLAVLFTSIDIIAGGRGAKLGNKVESLDGSLDISMVGIEVSAFGALVEGDVDGLFVGALVGPRLGPLDGKIVGTRVGRITLGDDDGTVDGKFVDGIIVGEIDGLIDEGPTDGQNEGSALGNVVGSIEGDRVGV